jgi:hypothetical protein
MLAAVTHLADCLPAFYVRPRLASLDPLLSVTTPDSTPKSRHSVA